MHHTYCDENYCADLLAKEGYSCNDNFALYLQPPSYILYQLLVDAWGVAYLDSVFLSCF